MEHDWSRDVKVLNELLDNCVQSWEIGYDSEGTLYFQQSLRQLGHIVDCHFELLKNHSGALLSALQKLEQRLVQKDIIGVQDCVEYEWHPMVARWKEDYGNGE